MIASGCGSVASGAAVGKVLEVIGECFGGAGDKGAFLDQGPNGLVAMLGELTAEEASRPVAGASIATHALHLAFSLDAFIEWIGGVRDVEYDWDSSWAKHEVSESEWDEIRERLGRQAAELDKAVRGNAPVDLESLWGTAGVLAHTAYHLGIIKVKLDELRSGGGP